MLPLSLIFLAGAPGTAGALIAAFSVTSALAPVRGRIVDRIGPRALTLFALGCAGSTWALVIVSAAGGPAAALAALSRLGGRGAAPLGPVTRAPHSPPLEGR